MKKTNIFTVLAIISLIGALFIPSFLTKNIGNMMLVCTIFAVAQVVFSIASIINAKRVEKSKLVGIILLIFGLLGILVFSFLYSFVEVVAKDPEKTGEYCKKVVNCEKGDNEISTCYIEGDSTKLLPIKCKNSNLTDEQFK